MKKLLRVYLTMLALAFWTGMATPAAALDVALSGERGGGTGQGRIAVVDMQKVYEFFPQTLNAKDDYMKKLEEKKTFLMKKQKDVDDIKGKIAVLESTLRQNSGATPPATSTETASVPSNETANQSLANLKAELDLKQTEYQDARKAAEDDLKAFEKQQNNLIFGRLYQSLKELADEEQVMIVVEKASILYGASTIDLTDKFLAKVRGY